MALSACDYAPMPEALVAEGFCAAHHARQQHIWSINTDGMGGAPQGHETRTLVLDEATSVFYVRSLPMGYRMK